MDLTMGQQPTSLYRLLSRKSKRRGEGPPDTEMTAAVETVDNDRTVEWLLGSELIE